MSIAKIIDALPLGCERCSRSHLESKDIEIVEQVEKVERGSARQALERLVSLGYLAA